MIEMQVKYRLRDSDTLTRMEEALVRCGFIYDEVITQDDAYYRGDCLDPPDLLRLRHEHGRADDFTDILTWKGASKNHDGVLERREINISVEPEFDNILAHLHLAIEVRLVKIQRRYRSPNFLASIDDVAGLGLFLELQVLPLVGAGAAHGLLEAGRALGFSIDEVVPETYLDLARKAQRGGTS